MHKPDLRIHKMQITKLILYYDFAIYIADYEKILREAQDGGIVVRRTKVHTLAYADMVISYQNERNDENNKPDA